MKGKKNDKVQIDSEGKFLAKRICTKMLCSTSLCVKVNQKIISRTLLEKSSLTSGDISNVIVNLVQELSKIMENGGIMQLGDLGKFKVSFTSEGVEEKGEFSTSKIKPKILFTPSVKLKKNVREYEVGARELRIDDEAFKFSTFSLVRENFKK